MLSHAYVATDLIAQISAKASSGHLDSSAHQSLHRTINALASESKRALEYPVSTASLRFRTAKEERRREVLGKMEPASIRNNLQNSELLTADLFPKDVVLEADKVAATSDSFRPPRRSEKSRGNSSFTRKRLSAPAPGGLRKKMRPSLPGSAQRQEAQQTDRPSTPESFKKPDPVDSYKPFHKSHYGQQRGGGYQKGRGDGSNRRTNRSHPKPGPPQAGRGRGGQGRGGSY